MTRLATLVLLVVTAVWGSTFYLTRDLVQTVPAPDYLGVRFAIAALVMVPLLHRQIRALPRPLLYQGIGLGAVYTVAQLFQTVGLEHTSASRSGFITGLYVVLTPILGWILLRDRLPKTTWAAVVLAVVGLAVLSLSEVGWGYGETLTLIGSIWYAGHIVWLSRAGRPDAALGLAAVQIGVLGVGSLIAAAPDGIVLPPTPALWGSLLYMAFVSGAIAMWAQTWAQSRLPATRAAIIMTAEPVFAAAFAIWFGGEHLTLRMVLGGGLVLLAMYVVELSGRDPKATAQEDPPSELLHHEGA